ncbi:hypothetical protein NIES2101_43625 [Calothrix sp. HK-06]|nr:hypothetical protein NIES2101_43625 [Calothrix sp. HK-06]
MLVPMLIPKLVLIFYTAIFRHLDPIANVNTDIEKTIGANSNTDTNTVRSTEVAPLLILQLGTDIELTTGATPPPKTGATNSHGLNQHFLASLDMGIIGATPTTQRHPYKKMVVTIK